MRSNAAVHRRSAAPTLSTTWRSKSPTVGRPIGLAENAFRLVWYFGSFRLCRCLLHVPSPGRTVRVFDYTDLETVWKSSASMRYLGPAFACDILE
jgi:hypothetical protein